MKLYYLCGDNQVRAEASQANFFYPGFLLVPVAERNSTNRPNFSFDLSNVLDGMRKLAALHP